MDQITPPQPPYSEPDAATAPILDDATITAADICDRLGRKAIADCIGVGLTAVSNASAEGSFSPAWFVAIKAMCDREGIACPERLFRFKIARPLDGAECDDCEGQRT